MAEPVLVLEKIYKKFEEQEVLKGISLEIAKGEFITLLGSSGCGKTTTLRIIAGLENPDSGRVLLDGRDVTALEPNRRDVNTIFQNYALFPHMNVEENIGYGLKIAKVSKEEVRRSVEGALSLVQLQGYEKRKVTELSGGQKQRVAIARAIVKKPRVLLLDEPLGALDLQLRRQMQLELKRLQKKLGITFIYITHDQEEAINMSDRIVVMNQGVFEQIGTPDEVYNRPETSFVARFVGNANVLEGIVEETGPDWTAVRIGSSVVKVRTGSKEREAYRKGGSILLSVRSENISFEQTQKNSLSAVVREKSFAGGLLRMELELEDGSRIVASRHGINCAFMEGESIRAGFDPEEAVVVSEERRKSS